MECAIWSTGNRVWQGVFWGGVWGLECGLWSVESELQSMQFVVWNVECGFLSLECEVWKVEYGQWSVEW